MSFILSGGWPVLSCAGKRWVWATFCCLPALRELDRSFVTAGCGARGVILCSDICHHDREICKYSAFRPLSESGRNGDVIYRH